MNEINNFFIEEEEKFDKRSQTSDFYLPLPRLNIKLSKFGGRTSLQFNLYNMGITTEFEKADEEMLSRFYRQLIELDLIKNNKKRRIIALDKLYKLFFVRATLDNSLKQLCYKGTNNNFSSFIFPSAVTRVIFFQICFTFFTSRFFIIFFVIHF